MSPSLVAVLGLLGAIALGAVATRVRALGDPDASIATLNALGIRVAFPALVLASLSRAPEVGGLSWLPGPLAIVVTLALLAAARRVSPTVRAEAGPLALATAFGNVAYLGLPLATAIFGEVHAGEIALAATAHVAVAITVGPLLLSRWGARGETPPLAHTLLSPLFLSVPAGFLLRWAPALPREVVQALASPIGATAAPIGAFVLGAYVERHLDALLRRPPGAASAALLRLVAVPAVTLVIARALAGAGALSSDDVRLAVLLAAMPCAVSTFAIAHERGVGADRAATAIVVTSLGSLLTVPAWLWLVG